MTIMTLRLSETMMIGDHIRVHVTKIFHHARTDTMQVKLGVEAPKEILVLRSEVNDRRPPSEEP